MNSVNSVISARRYHDGVVVLFDGTSPVGAFSSPADMVDFVLAEYGPREVPIHSSVLESYGVSAQAGTVYREMGKDGIRCVRIALLDDTGMVNGVVFVETDGLNDFAKAFMVEVVTALDTSAACASFVSDEIQVI